MIFILNKTCLEILNYYDFELIIFTYNKYSMQLNNIILLHLFDIQFFFNRGLYLS